MTAGVVYANYGSPADFKRLAELGIDVKGKIVIVRYGGNYRGIKVYDAQLAGAKGVLIYSDPADDGYFKGDMYPKGPYRPESAVQRGAVQFLPIYPGDATTPGVASTMDLPDSKRIPHRQNPDQLAQHSRQPTLLPGRRAHPEGARRTRDGRATGRARCPSPTMSEDRASPFTCTLEHGHPAPHHLGRDRHDRRRPTPRRKDNWVVAGNHRDAWVFGAVDPNSGTAAMLETVHGLGVLLKQGWRPKRRIVIGSWDAEEEGLIGSTEWVEEHENNLKHAVAYFNTDVGVSGPSFTASAVTLAQTVRS